MQHWIRSKVNAIRVRTARVGARVLTMALVAVSAGLWSPSATAFQVNLEETVTFGDSLTHNDILGIVYGNPQDMYGADPHEAVFEKGAFSGDELTNYAVAGSTSDDLATQVDFYDFLRAIFIQNDATLVGLEIGGNDVLDHATLLANNAPGTNQSADAVIDNIIRNIRANFLHLARTNPRGTKFIIWTIPDITVTPRFFGQLNSSQQKNLRAHIERANRLIRKVDRYEFIVVLDVYRVIQQMVATPPVVKGRPLQPPPVTSEYDALFADEIHPTAVSNAILANILITRINHEWDESIPLYTDDELAALAHIQ